jgi:hypothetical protein
VDTRIPEVADQHLEARLALQLLEPVTPVEHPVEHTDARALLEESSHDDGADVTGASGNEDRCGAQRRTRRWRW